MGKNQNDKSDLLSKTYNIMTANSILNMPNEDISQKKLFTSEFL